MINRLKLPVSVPVPVSGNFIFSVDQDKGQGTSGGYTDHRGR